MIVIISSPRPDACRPRMSEFPTIPAWIPADVARTARTVRLQAGDAVFTQGARPDSVDYVKAGEVHLLRCTPSGHDILLHRIQKGFIAEASLDAATYHCHAHAARASTLLRFDRRLFNAALDAREEFRRAWSAMLAQEIRRLRTQCERLALHKARDRIVHYIDCEGRHGVLELSNTRKVWAHELGMSHEALYRELNRLKDQGLLRIEGNVLTLLSARNEGPRDAGVPSPSHDGRQ